MAFILDDILIVDKYNGLIDPYNGLKMAADADCSYVEPETKLVRTMAMKKLTMASDEDCL